jgi:hypothetical protein
VRTTNLQSESAAYAALCRVAVEGSRALTAAVRCLNRLPAQGTDRIHKLFEEGFEMFRSGVLSVLPGEPC